LALKQQDVEVALIYVKPHFVEYHQSATSARPRQLKEHALAKGTSHPSQNQSLNI